jgi:hypothetical protein
MYEYTRGSSLENVNELTDNYLSLTQKNVNYKSNGTGTEFSR